MGSAGPALGTPGKSTLVEQAWRQAGPAEAAVVQRAAAPPPSHDETVSGAQAAKLDWTGKAGTFNLDAEKGMENKSLYEVFLAKFKEQLAKLSFKGETYDQIIARRDKLRASSDPDQQHSAGMIDEELWRARVYAIIETLKVEGSKRYQKKVDDKGHTIDTYCNVYAYDVVSALGAYVPRVWWDQPYLKGLESGAITVVSVDDYRDAQKAAKAKGQPTTPTALGKIAPIWAETVHELNANAIADWFNAYGARFGWRRTADLREAQDQANAGKVVVISASKKDTSAGHISVVIPEEHTATSPLHAPNKTVTDPKTKKTVTLPEMAAPLQSQAGENNFKYGVGKETQWWKTPDMRPEVQTEVDAKTGATKPVIDADTGKPVDAGNFWIYDGKEQATAIKPDAAPTPGNNAKTAGPPLAK